MVFTDRSDAGKRLAVALEGYRDERPIVLALPRGGVPVAAEVAAALNAPLASFANIDSEGHRGGGDPIGRTATR